MGGALLQLVAIGKQDVFLTGSPEITFWKVVYKRHTNFAIDSIKQTHTGSYPQYTYTIAKAGDLIHKCYLRVERPALNSPSDVETNNDYISYVNTFGHALIDSMQLKIGGVTVDTQTGEFLELWKELTITEEKREGFEEMIGIDGAYDPSNSYRRDKRTFYIPLQFFFCTNPGLSLPIIALQYHEVQIVFNFRKFEDMLTLTPKDGETNPSKTVNNILDDNPNIKKEFNIELFVDYVYLDVDERRRMAQSSHEMLVTQTKRISHMIQSTIDSDRIDLKNLNHPVKELIWVTKVHHADEVNRDYFDFGYSDQATDPSRGDGYGFTESNEIMKNASITLNGNDRVEKRDSMFYRCIQPYQHHTRIPNNYIYVYSFALKPEEVQPSGSCNFSRIDNAYLNVDNNTGRLGGGGNDVYEYVVYALNWNILRIQSGQAGIAFTN